MMDFCLRNWCFTALLHWSGIFMQWFVVAACLLGGPTTLHAACFLACSFHVLSTPLLGIFFPFSIP